LNKNFFIKTFGCQMNKCDSSIISHILEENGGQLCQRQDDADIVIINTCSVRAHAAARALGYISTLKGWRQKDSKILGVVGCMAQHLADRLATEFPYVDLVLGPDSYRKIYQYIQEVYRHKTRIIETTLNDETYCDIYPNNYTVTGFVSIMRGCNNFCSYCVVPYLRGRQRSRAPEDITREITHFVGSGVKDITLLGQNVNEYLYKGTSFADLLKIVAAIPNLFRLRFLTSHPKDLNDAILKAVKENYNICEWFHLPLQSGCNRILNLMNRQYTKEDYLNLITKIREEVPSVTITTDVIAGFPTETEEEFLETLSILEKIRFDDAYLYRYSSRKGTRAYGFKPLPEEVIKDRLKRLIDFQNKISLVKTEEMIGRQYEVLFEARAKNGGSRGKTRGNKDVIVAENIAPGEVRKVVIKEIRGRTPIGKITKRRE